MPGGFEEESSDIHRGNCLSELQPDSFSSLAISLSKHIFRCWPDPLVKASEGFQFLERCEQWQSLSIPRTTEIRQMSISPSPKAAENNLVEAEVKIMSKTEK